MLVEVYLKCSRCRGRAGLGPSRLMGQCPIFLACTMVFYYPATARRMLGGLTRVSMRDGPCS